MLVNALPMDFLDSYYNLLDSQPFQERHYFRIKCVSLESFLVVGLNHFRIYEDAKNVLHSAMMKSRFARDF